jgi:short-subunit dehydrogenase
MTATNNAWVLITGASSGFGEEFARQYAQQGHSLVLVARRLDRLQTIAATLRQQYQIDVVVEQVDLSDVEAVIQLMQRLRTRGIAIDILINNAGHGVQGPFVDSKLDASLAMLQLDGMSNTGFATAAQQKITPALKLLMMQPAPVVRAGIRALQARRISVVPGFANRAAVMFMRTTPRWLHQAIFSRIMNG